MKITVKDLNQKKFEFEVEPSITILQFKEHIDSKLSIPVEQQKLIFSGKILDNASTIEEVGITEQGFMVINKPTPKAAELKKEEVKPVEKPAEVAVEPQPGASANPTTDVDETTLVTGEAYEDVVTRFLDMGFEKSQIDQAMRAAFNNPARAADYLLGGIPDDVFAEPEPRTDASSIQAPNEHSQFSAADSNPASSDFQNQNLFEMGAQQLEAQQSQRGAGQSQGTPDLSQLRSHPQFQMLRQAIQQNPDLLRLILGSLSESHPEFMQTLASDPERLLDLLNEGADGNIPSDGVYNDQLGSEPHGTSIQVTPEEREAISRLEALGFDTSTATQAYFACDKNEELAANFLFEHGHDEQF